MTPRFAPPSRIDLGEFARGTACLTPALCANLAEAATVCLAAHGHSPGIGLDVNGTVVAVDWPALDGRAEGSHFDLQDATEEGAVALAIELVRHGTGLEVVRRSRKGTGFDYHLAPAAATSAFQGAYCLEVSGIFKDSARSLPARTAEKLAQVERGGQGLPGYVAVVGFDGPRAALRSFQ